jgi:hypothetical protein
MKINRKTAFVLVGLAILLGFGIALAPQYLTKPATQLSFNLYVHNAQVDNEGKSLIEMSPIYDQDGHLPRKMDILVEYWTSSDWDWHETTIPLAPMTLSKIEINDNVAGLGSVRVSSADTKWVCDAQSDGALVTYNGYPALEYKYNCNRTEPEVTADEKWGKGKGTYENPYDPDLLEGKYVKVMYYEGREDGRWLYARVKVVADGKEMWVRVGIGIELYTPVVKNGVTHYDYPDGEHPQEYWDLKDTGNVTDNFEGIWRVDPNYDDVFVSVYIPFKPTEKDEQIEKFWTEYQNGLKTMSYKGSWYMSNWDSSPYAKGYTMLENFPLIKSWTEADYDTLFELVTGEKSEPTSIGHLWSVYGMGSGSLWNSDTDNWDPTKGVQVMTFFRQPPNSEILGTLTPCSQNYPELIRGLSISKVEPATDSFGTIFSEWEFNADNGFYVTLGFKGEDYTDTMAVLNGTYFAFIPADQFIEDEWGVTDNRPAQFGTISLYQVAGCQK